MADTGYGVTVTFGTSSFAGEIVEVSGLDYFERAVIETTHINISGAAQATPKGKTFIPSDIYDPGTMTLVVNFESAAPGPLIAAAAPETISITFPDSDGKKFQATGFVTKASVPVPIEDRMLQTLEIKFSGDWDFDAV